MERRVYSSLNLEEDSGEMGDVVHFTDEMNL
jgi:hypothetical protein